MKKKVIHGLLILFTCIFSVTSSAQIITISEDKTTDKLTAQKENFLNNSAEANRYHIINSRNSQLMYSDCSAINSTITFSAPQTSYEVLNYINVNGVIPKFITGRVLSKSGEKLTFIANIEENSISEVEQSVKSNEVGNFVGIVSIQGYIDSENIDLIANDSKTLLLDTSYYVKDVEKNKEECLNSFPKDISWEYEEFQNRITR